MLVTVEKTGKGLMWRRVLWNVFTAQLSRVTCDGRSLEEWGRDTALLTRPQLKLNTC